MLPSTANVKSNFNLSMYQLMQIPYINYNLSVIFYHPPKNNLNPAKKEKKTPSHYQMKNILYPKYYA